LNSEYDGKINTVFARDWWERAGAVSQCENVIGKFVNNTKCYICGLPIEIDDNKKDESPQCEHILPVFKAVLYLTLYRSEYKDIIEKKDRIDANESNSDDAMEQSLPESLTVDEQRIYDELMMEYKWSHKCCNQKKGEIDFIEYKEPKKVDKSTSSGKFQLNVTNTKEILTSIANVANGVPDQRCSPWFVTQLKKKLNILPRNQPKDITDKIKKWVTERMDALQAKKIRDQEEGPIRTIIDYLNKYTEDNSYPLFTLINLCNAISASDMDNVHAVWRNIEGQPPIKNTPPESQMTKAVVITELTRDFSDKCNFDWGRERDVVYNLYKNIFDIPDSLQIPRLTKTGNNVKMSETIMFSLLDVNKNISEIGRFYRDFFSVITYSDPPLFSDEIGKAYASKLVGQAFKIMMIARVIDKIDNFGLDGFTNKDLPVSFKKQFEDLLVTECVNLKDIGKEYTGKINDNIQPYCDFVKYLVYFLSTVDIKDNKVFNNCSLDNNQECKDITSSSYVLPDKATIQKSVVEYYMKEAKFLKAIPEWNPDVPEPNDDTITTILKGVAVGSLELVSLMNSSEKVDDNDTNNEINGRNKEELINIIMEFTTENNLRDTLLKNPYFATEQFQKILYPNGDIENPAMQKIKEKHTVVEDDNIKEALKQYNNIQLSKIFIYLEKKQLTNELSKIIETSNEYTNQFNLSNLFGYYNLYREVYQGGGCDDIDYNQFASKWETYIRCIDVNILANIVEYVTQNQDESVTQNQELLSHDDSAMDDSENSGDDEPRKITPEGHMDTLISASNQVDAAKTMVSMAEGQMDTSKGGTKKAKKSKKARKSKKSKKAKKTKKAKKSKKSKKSKKAK
jgi:hypothetical protein